jgi:hypothetical protein
MRGRDGSAVGIMDPLPRISLSVGTAAERPQSVGGATLSRCPVREGDRSQAVDGATRASYYDSERVILESSMRHTG